MPIIRIIGIDPGYGIVGLGIIEKKGNNYHMIHNGIIKTSKNIKFIERLYIIRKNLLEYLEEFKPELAGVESVFFNNNQKTAINVAQARGVIVMSLYEKEIKVNDFTPLQVKTSITGYGRSDKKQIQYMVKAILGLTKIPKPDDAADALAIALAAGQSYNYTNILNSYNT